MEISIGLLGIAILLVIGALGYLESRITRTEKALLKLINAIITHNKKEIL